MNRDNFLWHLGFRIREYFEWEAELKGLFFRSETQENVNESQGNLEKEGIKL